MKSGYWKSWYISAPNCWGLQYWSSLSTDSQCSLMTWDTRHGGGALLFLSKAALPSHIRSYSCCHFDFPHFFSQCVVREEKGWNGHVKSLLTHSCNERGQVGSPRVKQYLTCQDYSSSFSPGILPHNRQEHHAASPNNFGSSLSNSSLSDPFSPAAFHLLLLSNCSIPVSVSALSFLCSYLFDERTREYIIFCRSMGRYFIIQISLTKVPIFDVASYENVSILATHVILHSMIRSSSQRMNSWILASERNTTEKGIVSINS